MTFLNPLVLFGLVAAAIPILIHLLNKRKLRTVEFSTITFLKELQKSSIRKITIRQWLLLLLRTLLIVCIVLAFSRPTIKGNFLTNTSHTKTSAIIILDNTMSMSLHNEEGNFLQQAKTQATQILNFLQEDDEAIILRLSEIQNLTTQFSRDKIFLKERVNITELNYKHRTIEEALRYSSQLLQQSKNFNKEIYIFTDGQKASLFSENATTEKLFSSDVKLFVVPLSSQQQENIGIVKVEIPFSLFQEEKSFILQATIKNYGTASVKNHLVYLTLDNIRISQKNITLEAGESTQIEFSVTPHRTGYISGIVELEEDKFIADDKKYFSIFIPPQRNILVSSSEPYLNTALQLSERDSNSTNLQVQKHASSTITTSLLHAADVVVFSVDEKISSTTIQQLSQFVKEGSGLMLFPTKEMNVQYYNNTVSSLFDVPTISLSKNITSFQKVDFAHPIFQGMFEKKNLSQKKPEQIESPKIFSSFHNTSETNFRSLITLSDNSSFMWEKQLGKGKIIGFSVPPIMEFSDFPMKGIFVPLMYQTILYLSSIHYSNIINNTGIIGERYDISLQKNKKNISLQLPLQSPVKIVDPQKREIVFSTTSSFLPFEDAAIPGLYTVQQGSDTLNIVTFSIDNKESTTELFAEEDMFSISKKYGIEENAVHFFHQQKNIENTILQSRFGTELWKYFLILAILFALAEMFFAREKKN